MSGFGRDKEGTRAGRTEERGRGSKAPQSMGSGLVSDGLLPRFK